MSAIQIKRFIKDKNIASDLLNILHVVNDEFSPALNEWVNLSEYANKMAERAVCWIAYDDDNPVAFAACYVNEAPSYSFWTMLAVCKEYRNRLIALQLETIVIQYCREIGSEGIKAEVDTRHTDLLQLHQRFGFKPVNTHTNDIGRSWVELQLDF